ncbi:NACHT domain-containing protein [Lentzea sp. HUAS TT2]|uniref:NACHT domain-containing protein n=1 Tax=Lentzea sp. HUAS TT2 TaxID=3447454 RepID=UPI003F6E85EC
MTSEQVGDATNFARVGEATNVVQVGEIHGDLNVGTVPRRAAPVEIASLMRAQILMADQLPYQLRGARTPSLSTVYVRQDLGTGGDELTSGEARPRPMVDGHGQLVDVSASPRVRTSVRPPSRAVREALESDDHLVITGGPGQGKSTLTLRLAAELALGWSGEGAGQATERVVPLRLPARELAARLDVPFAEALAASVRAEYNLRLRCAIDPSHFEERVSGCRWLLLVDGLDEVTSPAARDDLVHALAGWAASGDVYRIVLTTRPIEGGVLAPLQRIGATRYELQPFDEEALRTFAESWFSDDGDAATNFLRQIRKAYLDELVRVPLLATIAAIIFEQRRAHPLPDNQYELYEAYLKYLRTGHPHHPSPLDAHREPMLEHLGLVRVEADTSLLGAAQAWAAQHVPGDWHDDLVRFLTAVGPFTLRADDVHFLHHSFADHLAATAKARSLPADFSAEHNDFAHLLHAARPREHGRHARRVLLHYGRLHPPQADELLRTLNAGDSDQHLLAARLLAGHLPASSTAIEAFLATVRAWAMTTHYNAYDILAGASRATHHPGLPDWLAALMDDPLAPWTSRVEAAAALATRLRGRHEAAALEMLHAAVTDVEGQTGRRLIAAEALSECAEEQRFGAEPALRAILADPVATPREHRDAALVLAALGGSARVHAVSALLAMLNDPETSPSRLAEAANGLMEITEEHADRCAAVLVELLRTYSSWYGTELPQMAAETLGSLGTSHVAAGITALTSRITQVWLPPWERVAAAGVLARLGSSHRALAAKLIVDLTGESAMPSYHLWRHGEMLGRCGWEYREQAASMLRRALSDRVATVNTVYWAAQELRGLGPEYRAEAAGHLMRICESLADRHAVSWEQESALGALAVCDELVRPRALAELRQTLADEGIYLHRRDQAAYQLIDLGPEHHGEVVRGLRALAGQRFSLMVMTSALRNLARLDTRCRPRSVAVLTELVESGGEDDREPPSIFFTRAVLDDVVAAAGMLTRMLRDSERDERWRCAAVDNLIELGQPFHQAAVNGLIELIRSEAVSTTSLSVRLRHFADVADVFKAEVVQALRAVVLSADSTPEVVVNAAEALQTMLGLSGSDVAAVLRAILLDEGVEPRLRVSAAVLVASLQPDFASEAVAVLVGDQRDRRYWWNSALNTLALLGADPAPLLHEVARNADVRVKHRVRAISALVHLGRCEVAETLLRFVDDEYLDHNVRVSALMALAEIGSDQVTRAIEYHERVRDDRFGFVADRCASAECVRSLDMMATSAALDVWRQIASDPELTIAERAVAIPYLHNMAYNPSAGTDLLARAIAQDPECGAADRRSALEFMERKTRLAGQRMMLADRSIALKHRLPALDNEGFLPLRRETEAVVRDVFAAPESTHRERVAAATALAWMSSKFLNEGAELLDGLGERGREELAMLGPRWSSRVRVEARAVADDETRPWRERWVSSRFEWTVEPRSAEQRLQRAEACREVGVLRAMLADARPATRWRAAKRLREYDFADRVAGARVLEAIAGDPRTKAALRWRAGEELTRFGAKGRERGVAVLRHLMSDDDLPVTARAEAATVVGKIRPDLRAEVVRFLRTLKSDEELQRIRLHQAVGVFEPEDGARALRAMTETNAPLVRIRAAEAMLALRRDYRERAAVTARDVLHDAGAPWHVRRRAAADLARWSDLCLEEARAWLRGGRRP